MPKRMAFFNPITCICTYGQQLLSMRVFILSTEFASYPLSTTLDIRIIKKSDCLLCPAVKRDVDQSTHTAFVEILSFAGTQSYKEFFHEIGEKWIKLGGIPHWCKQWTFLEDVKVFEHIHKYYGDNISKFRDLLQALNGDDRMFVNQTMRKVLQL